MNVMLSMLRWCQLRWKLFPLQDFTYQMTAWTVHMLVNCELLGSLFLMLVKMVTKTCFAIKKKNYVSLVMNCFVWGKMSFHCICVNIFFCKRNYSLSLQVLITVCSCDCDEVHRTWKVQLVSLVFEIYPRIVTILFSSFYCVYGFVVICHHHT